MNNSESYKGLVALLVIIIVGLVGFIGYDKLIKKDKEEGKKDSNTNVVESNSNTTSNIESNSNTNTTSNVESNVTSNSNTTEQLTVRSYRFFGNLEGKDADMYTTLKLYSNNKYVLYANVCSGVKKYSGTYTETKDKVTFTGDIKTSFAKDGTSLKFDYSKVNVCNNTGGNFNLESDALGDNTKVELVSTKTYRFFGYLEGKEPDMYTTLKLYADNKYVLYANVCSGVKKYSGTYTATKDKITFTGDLKTSFAKDGDLLKFDYSKVNVCNNTGGNFSLESSALSR